MSRIKNIIMIIIIFVNIIIIILINIIKKYNYNYDNDYDKRMRMTSTYHDDSQLLGQFYQAASISTLEHDIRGKSKT